MCESDINAKKMVGESLEPYLTGGDQGGGFPPYHGRANSPAKLIVGRPTLQAAVGNVAISLGTLPEPFVAWVVAPEVVFNCATINYEVAADSPKVSTLFEPAKRISIILRDPSGLFAYTTESSS